MNKLEEYNIKHYAYDLNHIHKLGSINANKRRWIEDTMLDLRGRANYYEKVFASYLIRKGIVFIHQAPFVFDGKIYFADFYIPHAHTIIEIDGEYHKGIAQSEYDYNRDICFEGDKIKTIRIPNTAVNSDRELDLFCASLSLFVKKEQPIQKDTFTYIMRTLKKEFPRMVKSYRLYPLNGKKYYADIAIKSRKIILYFDGNSNGICQKYSYEDVSEAFKSIGYDTIRITNEEAMTKKKMTELIELIKNRKVTK